MCIKMKTIAIIPAYNEDNKSLYKVTAETAKYVDKVLVIDDGSKVPVKAKGFTLLRNSPNKGKGASLLRGFDYAVKNKFDLAITLDADGEHRPRQIPEFIEKAKSFDFVIGQRQDYRSAKRRIFNNFANFWFALLIPEIKDMYCGYRAITIKAYKRLRLSGSGFELEPEMLLEAVKEGVKIGYVGIETDPIEKSHFSANAFLRTNILYDKWILANHKKLRMNPIKRAFLIASAKAGLLISKVVAK